MAGSVIFNTINTGTMDSNNAIMVGENSAAGWDSHSKIQFSTGLVFSAFGALNILFSNLYILNDSDLLDTVIADGFETKGSPTTQV
jgi:hypothetical protein